MFITDVLTRNFEKVRIDIFGALLAKPLEMSNFDLFRILTKFSGYNYEISLNLHLSIHFCENFEKILRRQEGFALMIPYKTNILINLAIVHLMLENFHQIYYPYVYFKALISKAKLFFNNSKLIITIVFKTE